MRKELKEQMKIRHQSQNRSIQSSVSGYRKSANNISSIDYDLSHEKINNRAETLS
jgi:hypothetical protein